MTRLGPLPGSASVVIVGGGVIGTSAAFHLAEAGADVVLLERAQLVRRVRNGREHTLELEAAPLREVMRWASQFERFWNERLDRLEEFFNTKGKTS